ncbi:transglutaminase domain-containing protein [Chryseolinea lacunae]|uniref:Transglutaminase-like domain-containing protein n=1 Tax=Chryseolinea lacunae TaxID=2801331 RepID=A0ABS1KKV3_9BACT|nr:transglutaminase domain-containing protein [Chryseolinea lacunae]MBL0739857.1 hypothetical protein [Chryseolinea lacunae]
MKAPVFLLCIVLVSVGVVLKAQVSDFAHVDFRKADSVAALYPNHSLHDLRSLALKLTSPLPTDVEKFRAIYMWTCNNIENDYELYLKNKFERERLTTLEDLKAWNAKFNPTVFDALLNKHRTVCTGYAHLLRELCLRANLTCVIVDGYGRTAVANIGGKGIPNHSWSAVKFNGKWYLCDATWSSGAIDTEQGNFVKKYDASYFLAEPSLFVRNHYPLDSSWMLLKNKPTLAEFLNRPLTYTGIYSYEINQLSPETYRITALKGQPVLFQFKTNGEAPIRSVQLNISRAGNLRVAHPKPYLTSEGLYSVQHTFTSKGAYQVQVLLNAAYAFSYAVEIH